MKKCLLLLFLLLCACENNMMEYAGDTSDDGAILEEARMALDEGDYYGVIQLLADDYNSDLPDPEISRLLASAYMGLAGVDLTVMIANSDVTAGQDSFDTLASALALSTIIDGEARYLAPATAAAADQYLTTAANYLTNLIAKNWGSDDDRVQLGLASAIRFILAMGRYTAETAGTNCPLNQSAYQNVAAAVLGTPADLLSLQAAIDADIEQLRQDLINLKAAIDVIHRNTVAAHDNNNALENDLNEFLLELVGDTTLSAIETLSGTKITDYILAHMFDGSLP